ncbi:MAG TPA: protein-L-isoaspartate(D-aspartate) O-methyltransferase [Myxococcota bacterium]|nr:protein-L-isoaspartate(D-aspartate) O-methyltransferase [Myxococcota bacterium]
MDDGVRGARRSPGRAEWTVPRRRMVERLAAGGIRDRRVLAALAAVPRHRMVPEALQSQAYRDAALPIGDGQTISAPGTVAAMSEALELRGDESVLEIGTGSGYQAAILSQLAARVVSVERVQRLAAAARRALDRLGIDNVLVYWGDGTRGRPSDAPFDRIVVTAGGPQVPTPLLEQLAVGGCLVGPFGSRAEQSLLRVRRDGPHAWSEERLGSCRFVDLVGSHGWSG